MQWNIKRLDEGKLVRDYLLHDRAFSNRLLKQIKRDGNIMVNGQSVTVRHRLEAGDELEVIIPEEKNNLKPIHIPLNIVYEDAEVLIINKPRGLAVLPNMNDKVTLANGISYYYEKNNLNSSIHIVTRLDKNTSGLVIIAKNGYIHHLLSNQYIYREYRAMIEGDISPKSGMIQLPIARNLPSIIERKVDQNGKRAVTHYEVMKEMYNYSLLKVWLETGRTHQIRVHFSYLGHPLVGDDLYGAQNLMIQGQALHCRLIRLKHPIKGNSIICVATYPNEWLDMI